MSGSVVHRSGHLMRLSLLFRHGRSEVIKSHSRETLEILALKIHALSITDHGRGRTVDTPRQLTISANSS